MVQLTLPNGDYLDFDGPVTAQRAVETIGSGLARDALVAEVNDELVDLNTVIEEDADFKVHTWSTPEGKETFRHTTAHIMAQALLRVYPEAKITIGPPTEDGFYYDIDHEPFTPEDLRAIEEEMQRVVDEDHDVTRREVSYDEARELLSDNKYKLEILEDINEAGDTITVYEQGEFTDLCRGPHLPSTGRVKAFKLLRSSGAYWRGDETNEQLQRIYGTSFPKQKELDEYVERLEEAKKRDHRKLGSKHKLFTSSALVGKGLPVFQPKGAQMRETLKQYLWDLHKTKGYRRVHTPHIAKWDLYETSGHADKFGDELFTVEGRDSEFVLKPMNCPHHMQIYDDNHYSYRDLPIRYFEPGTVYRDEQSGELSGLLRVRSITQDDGHLFCTPDQIEQEVRTIVEIVKEFYGRLDMLDDYRVSLSVRDEDDDAYLGSDEVWEQAESALEEVAEQNGLPYEVVEGEAAFYGPKLDFMFKDALGREWQLATCQLDFNLPRRFDLSYKAEDNTEKRPVVIHRAITGSLERFLGVMIEHFDASFPTWLAPEQVRVVTVADRNIEYADGVVDTLRNEGFRVETDHRTESVGKKIRSGEIDKVPYVLVLGDEEEENRSVNVRSREEGVLGEMGVEEFLDVLVSETSA
jgi:threonyl-tRNA synthetase